METAWTSEMVVLYNTIWHQNLGDFDLKYHHCESLKTCIHTFQLLKLLLLSYMIQLVYS